jgi:hypothetical protein
VAAAQLAGVVAAASDTGVQQASCRRVAAADTGVEQEVQAGVDRSRRQVPRERGEREQARETCLEKMTLRV